MNMGQVIVSYDAIDAYVEDQMHRLNTLFNPSRCSQAAVVRASSSSATISVEPRWDEFRASSRRGSHKRSSTPKASQPTCGAMPASALFSGGFASWCHL